MPAVQNKETKRQDNIERLLKHLKEGSLAAKLVHAHGAPDPAESMKAVLRDRLQQVSGNFDGTEA